MKIIIIACEAQGFKKNLRSNREQCMQYNYETHEYREKGQHRLYQNFWKKDKNLVNR